MKKNVAAYWVFALTAVFVVSVCIPTDANAQYLHRTLSLRDYALQLRTPEDIAHYMWRHFTFEKDQRQFGKSDHWQSPENFLTTRKGDCEDFALFAYHMLKLNGIRAFLLNVYGERFAHSVCVFEENGKYNLIDGTRVLRFDAKDLKGLASKIYPFWSKAIVVLPSSDGHTAKVLTKMTR